MGAIIGRRGETLDAIHHPDQLRREPRAEKRM
jgi:hypothetical protein